MLRLTTFGGLTLQRGNANLTGAPTQRRRLAVFALLAVAGERGMSRDKLLAFLWPESEPERARHALNQVLHAQRQFLGEAGLFQGKKTLRLNPELIATDVSVFESALARDDPGAAVAAYGGPFLDGFHVREAAEFDRWVDEQREGFTRRCAAAVELLASRAKAEGQVGEEVGWRRRAVALAPLEARPALRLAEGLVQAGDRPGALLVLRNYQERLRTELGVTGDPEVIRMTEQLAASLGR